jgi:cation:H+ antiporter
MVVGGILLLALGASWLVDGASRLALGLGIAPMVVGLTVVGFGTSMPELSVSVLAAARGSGGLSLGNAIGSNIMNLLLVLGLAAVIAPIQVAGGTRSVRRDLVWGLVPALILLVAAFDGHIGRPLALTLIGVFAAFLATCLVTARRTAAGDEVPTRVRGTPTRHVLLTLVGIVVLVVGAESMVRGGVSLARAFGVSEAVIGLSLVAFGTSLPELATSVAAAVKRESDLSVGNVLGSNVFNLGLIVGLAFALRPGTVPTFVIRQDLPILVLATVAVGLVLLRAGRIGRREGVAMLGLFAAYVAFLAVRGG